MPERPNIGYLLNQPPEQIVNWFKDKGYAVSWNWREVQKEMHSRAFTVAKALDKDVLTTIRGATEDALQEGTTLRQFRKDLEPKLKELGWWGKREEVNPSTGEVEKVQLGSPWRLKTIYRTNMQTSYMRGRYQHQIKVAERRPWWMYDAVNDSSTRPSHAAHDNQVRRYDDPFWDTYYPPNGWGCRCVVRTLSDRQIEARNITPTRGMPQTPFASEGWDYNPAKNYFQPDLDQTWADISREYVKSALAGPGLGYMHQRIKETVEILQKKGLDLKDPKTLQQVRNGIAREEFPVAVLDDEFRKVIGAKGHTIHLSANTMVKQLVNHPDLSLADYRRLNEVHEKAQIVLQSKKNPKSLIFYHQDDNALLSVIKATLQGDKIYVSSFRKAGNQSIQNIRKSGKILKDEL